MSTELQSFTYRDENENYRHYEVLDIVSDVVSKDVIRVSPQFGGPLGIWSKDKSIQCSVYIKDESVDDLITYLQYYKHKKQEEGKWKSKE
jgi:hypothetical protein